MSAASEFNLYLLGDVVQIREALKIYFGFEDFRGDQEQIVEQTLAGGSSLVLMPTGMGKSLCYQLPACLKSGLTIVVSPLISLMKDQVDQAVGRKLKAVAIHSAQSADERKRNYDQLKRRQIQLLYITPERFRKSEFWQALDQQPIVLLAIDEAHCISQWGHDFRPDYSRLGEIRRQLGHPPTMALTATATPDVQKDILAQLDLTDNNCKTFYHGIERENLYLSVHSVVGLDEKVRRFVVERQVNGGPAIIYFSLVSTLEAFARQIGRLNFSYNIYHGQMDPRERRRSQEEFFAGQCDLILATPAFGLGIDKSDIRWILHAEIPGSIEAYYQEIGRAGRDGRPAHCALLYDQDDLTIQMDFIKWASPDPEFIRGVYALVRDYPQLLHKEGPNFIRSRMNFYNRRDFRAETALNLLERWGCIEGDWPRQPYRALEEPPTDFMDMKDHEKRLRMQNQKLLELVQLTRSKDCRLKIIYNYFGDTHVTDCGRCDNCIGEH